MHSKIVSLTDNKDYEASLSLENRTELREGQIHP